MASGKKRRKQASMSRRLRTGDKRGVHPDGDRRRRGQPTADQAIKDKQARQQFPGVLAPDAPRGSDSESPRPENKEEGEGL